MAQIEMSTEPNTQEVTLIDYAGRIYVRIRHADVCAPAEWGGDCVDGTPANLRLDSTGLFSGSGTGLPMPDFVINQTPGATADQLGRQSAPNSYLSLLKLSAKNTGKQNIQQARITKVDGGYEISAAFALALPKVPTEKECSIWVGITLFKDSNGVVSMRIEPLAIDALEFREGTIGMNCDKSGILIGNTGLQLSGVSGTINLRPDMQFVKLELVITPVTGGSKLFKASVGATLFWQPQWGVDLNGQAKIFKVFDIGGFDASVRETDMSFTGYIQSSFIRGDVEFYAWWPDGRFHFSGSGKVTLGVPKGAFFSKCINLLVSKQCIQIPPFDAQVGSVGVDGGEFTNGNYGLKGYARAFGKQFGFFLDDSGNFDIGGVSSYQIAKPPAIQQARLQWAQQEESGVARFLSSDDAPISFPAPDILMLNVPLRATDVVSSVTVANPTDTMFVISAIDPITVTLQTPSGAIITPANTAAFSATYTTTIETNYTQYLYDVTAAEMGNWKIIMEGDTSTNPPLVAALGFANIPTIQDTTLGDTSDLSQVEVNYSLTSDTPVTVTLFATPGNITSTVMVTDLNGVASPEVIDNFNGIPVTTMQVNDAQQLSGAQITGMVDLTILESGDYALWVEVDNGIHPELHDYVLLPASSTVARVTADNTSNLPTTWTATITPTIDRETGQIVVIADGLSYADVDSYGFNISQIPNAPAETILGGFAQYNRDANGLPIGQSYVRQTVDNVRPNETYYVSFIAMDEQSGWSVQSQEIAITIPAGDYQITKAQSRYQIDPSETISFPVTLDVLQPLFYTEVYLEMETQELPRGLTVLFEGDALSITSLSDENPTVNLIVTADETVPEGFYNFYLLGQNGQNEKRLSITIRVGNPQLYLPLVMNNYQALPDLVVQSVNLTANNMIVVIANVGSSTVEDDFWVDLYIDPNPVPTLVNQTWSYLGDQGVVWGITDSLVPGQALTLTLTSPSYYPSLSNFSGTIAANTPVYVQVDTANTKSSFGGIMEKHEKYDGVYNNISGPFTVKTTAVFP